jgi:hypothetical protein
MTNLLKKLNALSQEVRTLAKGKKRKEKPLYTSLKQGGFFISVPNFSLKFFNLFSCFS